MAHLSKREIVERVNAKLAACDVESSISEADIMDDDMIDGMPWRQWVEAMTMD